jgi:hypothetical protein
LAGRRHDCDGHLTDLAAVGVPVIAYVVI